MADIKMVLIILICLVLFKFGYSTSYSDARDFIDRKIDFLNEQFEIINFYYWAYDDLTELNEIQMESYENATNKIVSALWEIKHKYQNVKFSDENFNRQIKGLTNIPEPIFLSEEEMIEYNEFKFELLKNIEEHEKLAIYQIPNCYGVQCSLVSLTAEQMNGLLRELNDEKDWKSLWISMHQSQRIDEELLINFVKFYKNAADQASSNQPLKIWYENYVNTSLATRDDENFLLELINLVRDMKPLYIQLHAYIRNKIMLQSNESDIKPRDQIPIYVIDALLTRFEEREVQFELPYPQINVPNISLSLDNAHFNSRKLLLNGNSIFVNLNLPDIYSEFWHTGSKHFSKTTSKCKNRISTAPFHVSLKYCDFTDQKSLHESVETMFNVQYFYQFRALALGLRLPACPGFDDGIGKAFALSTKASKYLLEKNLIANPLTDEQIINRLYLEAFETLFSIHKAISNEILWTDLLLGRAQPEDLNCKYWEQQNVVAGIRPPPRPEFNEEKNQTYFDIPDDFLSGILNRIDNTKSIISTVLAYQIHRSFCLVTGEYSVANLSMPLHNCVLDRKTILGHIVKEVMSHGYMKPWREILNMLIGERRLNARGIMEYFQPLQIWLENENRKNGVWPGWNEDVKNCARELFETSGEAILEESSDATIEANTEAVIEENTEENIEENSEPSVKEISEVMIEETSESAVEESSEATIEEASETIIDENTSKAIVEETSKAIVEETSKADIEDNSESTIKT